MSVPVEQNNKSPASATITPAPNSRYQRDPFPGNIIPASRIHPAALTIIDKYFPLGNVPGTVDGLNDYITSLVEKNRFMSHVFRIDHAINQKNRLFFRGSANNRYQDFAPRFHDAPSYNYWRYHRGFG